MLDVGESLSESHTEHDVRSEKVFLVQVKHGGDFSGQKLVPILDQKPLVSSTFV